MTTRSAKKTTTTTTVRRVGASETASPGVSTPSTSRESRTATPGSGVRSPRPPSPTVISRRQEKAELSGLNDRLAVYIERVRQLELENKSLSTKIQAHEETVTREVTNIKALYEAELADARRMLDQLAKEKAKLQIEVGKFKKAADDWKEKYVKRDKEATNYERRMLAAEAQVNDLQARLNDAINQRKHWENEYNKIKSELNQLEKLYETARKQLEEETMLRVDLENRNQSLKEELAFKTSIHEQELNETRTRTEIVIDETDGRIQKQYEGRLKEAIQDMREENEYNIRITRDETESAFQAKLDDLKDLANRKDSAAAYAREELLTARRRVDELSGLNSELQARTAGLEAKIAELESALLREQVAHENDVDQRDAEIRFLREALESQVVEYRDLMDIKIALDMEIQTYRKLLESEETRLNITSDMEATPGRATPRQTPLRGTPLGTRKRKRTGQAVSQYTTMSSSGGFESSSSATGPVEVYETEETGKYIKLYNTSDKDLALGGWQLRHTAGDEETTYKFHRSLHLKAGEYTTVWSADTETTHAPPHDLVMKGQRWGVNNEMTSTLLNNKGEEVAERHMKRSLLRMSRTLESGDSGFHEGDPNQDEKCVIM